VTIYLQCCLVRSKNDIQERDLWEMSFCFTFHRDVWLYSFWRYRSFPSPKFIHIEDDDSRKQSAPKNIPNGLIALSGKSFLGTLSHWIVLIQWQPQNRHSISLKLRSIIEHQHQNAYLSFQ
jgi:hypothetical protein